VIYARPLPAFENSGGAPALGGGHGNGSGRGLPSRCGSLGVSTLEEKGRGREVTREKGDGRKEEGKGEG